MHCLAGLDSISGGQVWIGDTELVGALGQGPHPAAPRRRRLRLPGLQPGPDADGAGEHHAPARHRRPQARPAVARHGDRHRRPARPARPPAQRALRRPAAARRRAPARWPAGPTIVFADEPTGNLDSRSGAEVLGFLRRSVDEFGQTIVMVTHDPGAASLRRPRPVPRRRPDRRRDARAHGRRGARADEGVRGRRGADRRAARRPPLAAAAQAAAVADPARRRRRRRVRRGHLHLHRLAQAVLRRAVRRPAARRHRHASTPAPAAGGGTAARPRRRPGADAARVAASRRSAAVDGVAAAYGVVVGRRRARHRLRRQGRRRGRAAGARHARWCPTPRSAR